MRRVFRRLWTLVRRGRAENELAREIASHLAHLQAEYERRGFSPGEARLAARRAFGGIEQTKEMQRDARSFLWLEDFRRDVGYGVRTLTRTPGFSAIAIMTLALGVGAATVIYSVLRNVVLDPFPYSRSDRLVNVVLKDDSGRIVRGPYFPASEFLDYQEQVQAFEDVVGTSQAVVHWANDAGAERLIVCWMTPNGFDFLGVRPLLGRVFGAADATPEAPPVAVMNHRAWVRFFAADPGVIGRTLVIDGEPRTVIGVMPPRFEWNVGDLWLPAAMQRSDDPQTARGTRAFQAHLRPGVTRAEAEAQLNVVGARRIAGHPKDYPPHFHFEVIAVVDWVVREFRGVLYTLFGAVSLLLMIACCNVANMLLARATTREREISIRAAIGASRGRILRQLLTESALLACGGALVGCLLAYGGIAALALFMPRQGVPWETEIRLDRPVLLFALAVAAVATLAFGLFPAVQSARADVAAGANVGARGTSGRRQSRMRSGLVVVQVALSIVLLLGAGLLMRTFVSLMRVDLGFDPKHLLVTGAWFPPRQQTSADQQWRFYREALARIEAVSGVQSAAIANGVAPFANTSTEIEVAGRPTSQGQRPLVLFCSERLAETIGLTLLKGRTFTAAEVDASRHLAVINETLAKKYFEGGEPLGQTVRLPRFAMPPISLSDPTFELIGIFRDVMNVAVREPPAPQLLVPAKLRGPAGLTFVVRTTGEPMRVATAVRDAVHTVDPQVALLEPAPLDDLIARQFFARPRFSLLVLGIFAVTGLALVALGVYGVLAYTVSQQTREIAIRMALGGDRGDVVRMVLRLGLGLVGAGLVAGSAASLVTNRLLVDQLWNTSPHDPATFGAAVAVIIAIGAAASWIPARRAVRVEPMVALRHE